MSPAPSAPGPAEKPAPPAAIAFESTLTRRGYRGVMLHLAARSLRFAPALVAVGGMLAYGTGARSTAFALFATLLAIPLVVWGYVSWLANAPSATSLYAPVSWGFSAEGIRYSTGEGGGEIEWDDVIRWRVVVDHLMLYVSGSNYLLVPVDAVPESDRDSLRELLVAGAGNPPRRFDGLR